MPEIPQDWSDSKKLWDVMGKTPAKKPSAEFNHVVKQKTSLYSRMPGFNNRVERKAAQIAEFRRQREAADCPKSKFIVPVWTIFIVVGIVCLVLTWAGLQPVAPPAPARTAVNPVPMRTPLPSTSATLGISVEALEIARHYELIRDMDVIERLDEVKP